MGSWDKLAEKGLRMAASLFIVFPAVQPLAEKGV